MPRFVILLHRVDSGFTRTHSDHHDWLFEHGDSLRSFATPIVGDFSSDFQCACRQLPNHRMKYLHYEGPISDNRGTVLRILSGTFEALSDSPERFTSRIKYGVHQPKSAEITIHRPDQRTIDDFVADDSVDARLNCSAGTLSFRCIGGENDTNS